MTKETLWTDDLELFHFAFRRLVAEPDRRLESLGLNRSHHRVLHFIAKREHITITELVNVMNISRQALHRPLLRLIDTGYVIAIKDEDNKRQKFLRLSKSGKTLLNRLSGYQLRFLQRVFDRTGGRAEAGWRDVMAAIAETTPASEPDKSLVTK